MSFIDKLQQWLQGQPEQPLPELPGGQIDFGNLRRVTPVTRSFGFERGQPVDRYYIDQFLSEHAGDIQGHVLEIGDNHYTHQFGHTRITQSDVLDLNPANSNATIIADLTAADHVPSDTFDCIIFTQTLQFIYDLQAAIKTLQRILKPEGVLLATFPVISQICRYDMDRWGDYWRFTNASIRRLLGDVFALENVMIETHGNILVAIAFLHGLSAHELKPDELNYHDPDYQLLITARAVKRDFQNLPGSSA